MDSPSSAGFALNLLLQKYHFSLLTAEFFTIFSSSKCAPPTPMIAISGFLTIPA
jgi:hypothetical protein